MPTLCKNCRKNELRSKKEKHFGVCWKCLATVERFIRDELKLEPDYLRVVVIQGEKYIAMKKVKGA